MQTVTTATTKDIVIKKIVVTLNDEQIKSLPSTVIDIIPQVADNENILIFGGYVKIQGSAGAYTNLDNQGVIALQITGVVVPPYTDLVFGLQSENKFSLFPKQIFYKETDIEFTSGNCFAGQPRQGEFIQKVAVSIDNFDATYATNFGNFTGGHPDNYMIITIIYSIIS